MEQHWHGLPIKVNIHRDFYNHFLQKNIQLLSNVFIFFLNIFFGGFDKIVQTLIKKGANVNELTEELSSALILAAMNGKISKHICLYCIPSSVIIFYDSMTQGERVLCGYSLTMTLT